MSDRADWTGSVAAHLDGIRAADRWRSPRALDAHGPTGTLLQGPDGRPLKVVTFASNDYLGLSAHPAPAEAARAAIDRWGTGAGAARLVTGDRPVHDELEAALADWKGTERAVLFPTGFAANLGTVTALARVAPGDRPPLVCSDELNHASIIDAARLARAEVAVYPHRDLDALDRLLVGAAADGRAALVVTDTVFSMDGDVVDLPGLLSTCARHGAAVVLDEAHAVLGPELPVTGGTTHPTPPLVVRVGTLSKTLGALGGFAATTADVADLLVNTARSYIFTTGSSPADAAAALAALGVLRGPEGAELLARLRRHIDTVRAGHPSPIVPVVIGDEADAVAAAERLLARGLLVPAIRPPTVAPGTARLRVTLCATHTDEQVARLVEALAEIGVPTP